MRSVARRLFFERRPWKPRLPDKRRDRLHFVGLQPELRHLRGGTEFMGMLQPVGDPLFVDLHPHFFEVRTNFFGFLQQTMRALIELLDLRVHGADGDGKVVGLLVESVGRLVVGGRIALLVQARNIELVGLAVAFQLQDLLPGADQ